MFVPWMLFKRSPIDRGESVFGFDALVLDSLVVLYSVALFIFTSTLYYTSHLHLALHTDLTDEYRNTVIFFNCFHFII